MYLYRVSSGAARAGQSQARWLTLSASRASNPAPGASPAQSQEHDAVKVDKRIEENAIDEQATKESTKTTAQADEELRLKMAGLSGDGGEAGVEYEDGQPVAMKRSVKNNMFRYI